MKEKPILFNGAMVRAILSGAKTQTRRVVKQLDGATGVQSVHQRPSGLFIGRHLPGDAGVGITAPFPCPFGQAGDRLWVRETWSDAGLAPDEVHYRADATTFGGMTIEDVADTRWRPSIHMPRWACRLVLEITEVRVERLQELSNADWDAEGISFCMEDPGTAAGRAFNEAEHYAIAGVSMRGTPEDHGMRAQLAEQGLDWDSNPWVWVITFKRIEA